MKDYSVDFDLAMKHLKTVILTTLFWPNEVALVVHVYLKQERQTKNVINIHIQILVDLITDIISESLNINH